MERLQTKDWDRDRVWLQIEGELQKKRRKRALWFWWLGVLCFGLLTFTTYLYLHHHDGTELGQLPIYGNSNILNENPYQIGTVQDQKSRPLDPSISSNTSEKSAEKQVGKQTPSSTRMRPLDPTAQMDRTNKSQLSSQNPKADSLASPNLIAQALATAQELGRIPVLPPLSISPSPPSYRPTALILTPNKSLAIASDSTPWKISFNSTWSSGNVRHFGSETWINAKDKSESFNLSSSHSLLLKRPLDSHCYAYLGIQHQLVLNTYNFTTESINIQTVPNDSAVVYHLDGLEPIYEPGTLQETTTSRRWIVRNNRLQRWSIPLGLGYVREKGRLGFQASMGLNFQFWQGFSGVALDEGSQTHLLNQSEIRDRYYRNPWQFNFNSSLALSYKLHPRYTLLLGVDYQKDNLFSIRLQPNRSAYQLWGLSVGMRMPFSTRSANK